ncbi:MAG: type 1 glutamine amidotransferase [Woeseiaceae bacterium]
MARPKVLVFQHVPFEPLGTLDPLLKHAGFRIRYVNFARDPGQVPTLDGYSALIVLGGPMNVDQVHDYPNLAIEVSLISEALERGVSVLGICLGAQLLARALGSPVRPDHAREIGWYDVDLTADGKADPVLSAFGTRQQVFQWHEDAIELPAGAVHLASSKACEVQAFRFGDSAYGFQFHLEVDGSLIERWLDRAGYQPLLQEMSETVDPEQIREQTNGSIRELMELSDTTFSRWIDRFEIGTRRRTLPSR